MLGELVLLQGGEVADAKKSGHEVKEEDNGVGLLKSGSIMK